jgi:RNA polymerase sigma-70 factor (ECF subfamily)
MQNKLNDIEIIDAVLAGDVNAYADLVKRHQNYVFTLAMRFTKNREEAEEVAQDAFVKGFKYLKDFKRTAKFTTWLHTIVYTTAMTYLRKNRLKTSSMDDEENPIELESKTFAIENNLTELKSRAYYLNQAIENLPPVDATIITLFYKGEQSLEEIAQIMQMDANTIKVKLHRARLKLKEKLNLILKDEVKDLL